MNSEYQPSGKYCFPSQEDFSDIYSTHLQTCPKKITILTKKKPHSYVPFFRPEDHIGPEQEAFQIAYVNYLKKNLKFKPSIQTRYELSMDYFSTGLLFWRV
jgi:hypothetical protein